MKYKLIDAMLHNFGHSFTSDMSYVDDDVFIMDVLPELARKSPNREIHINFSNGCVYPSALYPDTFKRSVSYWQDTLPEHIKNHRLEPNRLSDIYLIFRLVKFGYEIIVFTTDDRGKQHKVFVHH